MQKPDFEWYSALSDKANGPKRCPFASANRCPRYYESVYLLGEIGITTKISPEDEIALDKQWESFRTTLREEAASISGGAENDTKAMSNFCPEVNAKIFGLYASGLYPHHGEIDRDIAYSRLAKEGVSSDDPQWRWAGVTPCHYTECPEYSILQHESQMKLSGKQSQSDANQVFNIGAVQGNVGNVSHSQATFQNNRSIYRLLIDTNIPINERHELERLMEALKSAPEAQKLGIIEKTKQWIAKNKEFLGATAEIISKAIGSA